MLLPFLIGLSFLSFIAFGIIRALTRPLVMRQIEVNKANRQYMIENNTTVRPYN